MASKQIEFKFLTWEIDTTGRYLLDEVCHMSARAIDSMHNFDEYIMPHRNITFSSTRKIQLYTLSVGMYRSLRRTTNGMVVKTNTEIVTLKNFLTWLDDCGRDKMPIILMCYEPYEFSPYILLQALKRYEMLDQFKTVVHGFANVYAFIKKKCKKSVSSMSLRTLAKIFLDKNNIKCLDSQCRADLVKEILLHLSEDSDNPGQNFGNDILNFISTVDEVDQRLCAKLEKRTIQSSLKPIFLPYLKEYRSRRRALALRNILTFKSNFDFSSLQKLCSEGIEELKKELSEQISAPDKDIKDLAGIIYYHFQNASLPNSNKATLFKIESDMKALKLE